MTVTTNLPPPQRWCEQSQPHNAHIWVTREGLYANCGGHS